MYDLSELKTKNHDFEELISILKGMKLMALVLLCNLLIHRF